MSLSLFEGSPKVVFSLKESLESSNDIEVEELNGEDI
jgi:hypothetical protein